MWEGGICGTGLTLTGMERGKKPAKNANTFSCPGGSYLKVYKNVDIYSFL